MPKCRICGEYFIGGNPKDDENLCMWCYAKLWAKNKIANKIAEIKQKQ